MTDEERRLAELLHQAVPQPPRRITAADIAAEVARRPAGIRHRFGPWLPAVAAASVLLVIAASSMWLISGHAAPSSPTAQSSSAATSAGTSAATTTSGASTSPSAPSSSARRSASTSTAPRQLPSDPNSRANQNPNLQLSTSVIPDGVIGAFGATLLNAAPIGPIIVSGPNAVYGLDGGTIDRFDPSSGAITAQAPAGQGANWPLLVTGQALWQTVVGTGAITVRRLDPRTLRELGSSQIPATTPSSGEPWTPALAAAGNGVFLGNADQLYSLDLSTGAVEHQVSIAGLVGALAVSPDGNRLFVGVNVQGSAVARLLVLDIGHGMASLSDTALGAGPVSSLLATSGGVWATVGPPPDPYGVSNNIRFAPLADLAHTREIIPGGGGMPATATLAGGTVFLSGIYTIECADPGTAAVRGQAQQMGELGLSHNFLSVQLVAGHYLASFQTNYGGGRGLAILAPPAACR